MPTRNSASIGVTSGLASSSLGPLRRNLGPEPAVHFLEEEPHPVGQYLDLLLLQQDADHPRLVYCLEIERPVAGLTHRPGDESVRSAKYVNCA